MSQLLLFACLGLGPGALIAGIALAIVLTYRGTGVVHLGSGAVAMIAAYVFYDLRNVGALLLPPLPFLPATIGLGTHSVAALPAFVITMAVCVVLGLVLEILVFRPVRGSSPLARLLVSLGVLIVLQAVAVIRFGSTGQSGVTVLPETPSDVVKIGSVPVPSDRFVLAAIVIFAAGALALIYRFSRFGLATRAASEKPDHARLLGLYPDRLGAGNTILGSLLAGGLGVLVAPLTQLDPSVLPLTVVPALAAALLAGFTSFGVAAAAGLAIGVLQELVFYFSTLSWFPTTGGTAIAGVSDVIVFLIIAATLYVRGVPLPPRGVLEERRLPAAPAARSVAIPAVVMTLIGFVALLALPSDFRQALVLSMIGTVVCLSLVVITGFTGQIAFSQVALGGVSGLLLAKISAHLGIGFPIAPLIAVLGATALGLLVGLSGLRVRGVNLAVVTLAAAVAIEQFWFNNSSWGGGLGSVPVPEAKLFGIDLGPRASFPTWDGKLPSPAFGLFCLVVTVALCVLVANVRRSSLGERMLAVRANERAAAAQTLNVRHVKIAAFGISSFIAGCAGVLYAYNFESVSTGNFGIVAALPFVAFAYIGGISTVTGAVISGLLVSEGLLPHAVEKWLGIPPTYELYLAGLLLIFNLTQSPEGIAGVVVPAARKRWRWLRSHTARPVVGDDPDVIEQVHP